MKQVLAGIFAFCGSFLAFIGTGAVSLIGGAGFEAEQPAAVTCCGQCPDSFTVSAEARKAGIIHTYDDMMGADKLDGFKTLIVVMGGSTKGLGEAGLTAPMELSRVSGILARAKRLGIKIIGVHIGGSARRGKLSEDFIRLVSTKADCMIVTVEGNTDNYFTKEAKRRTVPLYLLKSPRELGAALKTIFHIN